MKNVSYLIIGGDGIIGSCLADTLRSGGKRVISTSRKSGKLPTDSIFLDLNKNLTEWKLPDDVQTVFFCAAVTSIKQCNMQPHQTRIVNVENTCLLASRFLEKGIHVIFPSSNLVFDGEKPFVSENESVCPKSEYGRQKASVEQELLTYSEYFSVFRLSKVIRYDMPLFRNWIKTLKHGKPIHPFFDLKFSPIPAHLAVEAFIRIAEMKALGIFHMSADRDISYADFGVQLARKINVPVQLVQPVKSTNSGIQIAPIPKHTTLGSERIKNELGLHPPTVFETIDCL